MKIAIVAIVLASLSFFGVWYFISDQNKQSDLIRNGYGQKQNAGTDVGSNPPNQILENNQQEIMNATINTNKGSFTIELFENLAPNTVTNFIKLAESGFYGGVKFHRVIDDFMVQSGDPLTKDDNQRNLWGTGGPGYKFADEIHSENKNLYGTISMANAGPNTNGSQFFINVANNNLLDTRHTVFGKVIKGMDVIDAISKVSTDQNDVPLEPVIIQNIILD